jgi:hypothetical protein
MPGDDPTPEELRAEAERTIGRLQVTASWLIDWLRAPEPVIRLREGGTVEHAFELVKGLADLGTLLATQLGQQMGLSAEDVLQQLAGATLDPDLGRAVAETWAEDG